MTCHHTYNNRMEEKREAAAIEQTKKHEEYERYILEDPKWKEIRRRVLTRARNLCEACLVSLASEVHHLNYDHLFNEIAWDLKAVCRPCHQKIHGRQP